MCQACDHIQDWSEWADPACPADPAHPTGAAGAAGAARAEVRLRYIKEELFLAQLLKLGYRPAGPLIDIKLLSGELEEIHLPHSLCLGSCDPVLLRDAVRALHADDSGISLETCELGRSHGRVSGKHFSLWQLVVRLGFPVRDHCEVLIYEHCPRPLVLHIYPLPSPSTAQTAVKEQYQQRGASNIIKPRPNMSLLMGSTLQLHTSCLSEVTPPDVTLTYNNPPFFEVCVESPAERFIMKLHSAEKNQPVWTVVMRRGADYHRRHADEPPQRNMIPGQVGTQMAAAFLEEKRSKLIQRVTEVMPIADQLLSQEVIGNETYAKIQAAATSQDKMRLLFDGLRSAGAQGKLAFYNLLREQHPRLVEELWTAS